MIASCPSQEFSGRWVVEPDPTVRDGLQFATILRYELSLVPRWPLPSALVTHVVQAGLPANIRAVAWRAEEVHTNILLAAIQVKGRVCLHIFSKSYTVTHLHSG